MCCCLLRAAQPTIDSYLPICSRGLHVPAGDKMGPRCNSQVSVCKFAMHDFHANTSGESARILLNIYLNNDCILPVTERLFLHIWIQLVVPPGPHTISAADGCELVHK